MILWGGSAFGSMLHDAPALASSSRRRARRDVRAAATVAPLRLVRVRFDPTMWTVTAALLAAILVSSSEATPRLRIYPKPKAPAENTAAIVGASNIGEIIYMYVRTGGCEI